MTLSKLLFFNENVKVWDAERSYNRFVLLYLLCPFKSRFFVLICTISKVKIDKILIRYSCFLCELLKIVDSSNFNTKRNLFFQMFTVRIFYRLAEIIICSHLINFQYCFCSCLSAFLADINLICVSLSL